MTTDYVLRDFGQALRERREVRPRITQEELAKKLNCTSVYVSLLENGKRKPSGMMAKNINAVTGLDCWSLVPEFDWIEGRK